MQTDKCQPASEYESKKDSKGNKIHWSNNSPSGMRVGHSHCPWCKRKLSKAGHCENGNCDWGI